MRFAIIDPEGDGLSWSSRLTEEGSEVLHYIHKKDSRTIGEGIVPKTNSMYELLAWSKAKPTVAVFMFSGMGKSSPKVPVGADEFAKAGVSVVLGGSLQDRLENDRDFGISIAEQVGVRQPPYFKFGSARAAQAFCKQHGGTEWYFKPDSTHDCDTTFGGKGKDIAEWLDHFIERFGDRHTNIVQMRIPGIAVSTASWFNGYTFLDPFEGTLEHKKFMNGDVGPSTGCAINVVWMYPERPKIAEDLKFDEVGTILAAKGCTPCLIDINSVIAEESGPWGPKGKPYFLEWTPRCGWDSEATSQALNTGTMSGFLLALSNRTLATAPFDTNKFAYGVRVTVPPYPHISQDTPIKPSPQGKPLRGITRLYGPPFSAYSVSRNNQRGYHVGDDSGIIGVVVAVGTKLSECEEEAIKFAKEMKPTSLQYRTDGAKTLGKDAKTMNELGYWTPKGILE